MTVPGLELALVAVLGLAVGSFLNVVVHRVPVGESVVSPPSRCPGCSSAIRPRHNVPVLGWLLLRGRCADCAAPISPRYPVVEATTAALFVAVTAQIAKLDLAPALPAYLYLAAAGLALALIDVEHHRLPDAIVLPSYVVVAVLFLAASAGTGDWWALARATIGGAALYGCYFTTALAYPGGMGFGDVKLAGVLGAVLGYLSWSTLVVGAAAGFLLGAFVGVPVALARGGGRRSAIPFGPFMIAGALLAVFVAQPVAHAYLHLIGA